MIVKTVPHRKKQTNRKCKKPENTERIVMMITVT